MFVQIDGWSVTIRDLTNNRDIEAKIGKLTKSDFRSIKQEKRFEFDWDAFSQQEVYKLGLIDANEILGLICVEDRSDPGFDCLEIIAIETRKDQRGHLKTYDRIAGCLFAFAARLAFKNGHEGMIFLIAKTKTSTIFNSKYGFDYLGNINTLCTRMASSDKNSQQLIRDYL